MRILTTDAAAAPWTWSFEPGVVGCLAFFSMIYAAGVARLVRERRWPAAGNRRAALFATGIALVAIVLLSPVDAWADALFSAHMAQHLVLMMVAPPLLVLGHPVVTALWSLPPGGRRAVAGWWNRSRWLRPLVDGVGSPLSAWLASSAALWFWHLPRPYAAAFDDPLLHASEHLSFLVAALLFWRVVIEDPQSRRLSLGATMLFLGTFAMQNGMLGAILTFAPHVLYAVHAVAPPWSPLDPLEDQQLAGISMWLVTGVIDLGTLGALFVTWLASGARRTRRA